MTSFSETLLYILVLHPFFVENIQKPYIFKALALWADAFSKLKCPSVRLSVCPSVCPSVRPSVRVFTFVVPFKRLFAPTARSRISNIFRDL